MSKNTKEMQDLINQSNKQLEENGFSIDKQDIKGELASPTELASLKSELTATTILKPVEAGVEDERKAKEQTLQRQREYAKVLQRMYGKLPNDGTGGLLNKKVYGTDPQFIKAFNDHAANATFETDDSVIPKEPGTHIENPEPIDIPNEPEVEIEKKETFDSLFENPELDFD